MHYLYFVHDREEEHYLPVIPYVEEHVEEPFSAVFWAELLPFNLMMFL